MTITMKIAVPICALLVLLGCAPTPADPEAVFTESFELPLADASIILGGGAIDEPWIVFTAEERVTLKDGEKYQTFDPQPAYDFFVEKIPLENLGNADHFVCLSWRETQGASDTGAHLMFIPGSGTYYFRSW